MRHCHDLDTRAFEQRSRVGEFVKLVRGKLDCSPTVGVLNRLLVRILKEFKVFTGEIEDDVEGLIAGFDEGERVPLAEVDVVNGRPE